MITSGKGEVETGDYLEITSFIEIFTNHSALNKFLEFGDSKYFMLRQENKIWYISADANTSNMLQQQIGNRKDNVLYVPITQNEYQTAKKNLVNDQLQATSTGLIKELKNALGSFVHTIDPELSSIHCLLSHNSSERREAAINYTKIITGFTHKKEEAANEGFLYEGGGQLKKPIIMFLKTSRVIPRYGLDATAVGGSHWTTAIILPRNYKTLSGTSIGNKHERVYFIDPLFKDIKLPEEFKTILKNGTAVKVNDGSILYIPAAFPEAEFYDCMNVFQQAPYTQDCGWWSFYNALEIINTGKVDFLNDFSSANYQEKEKFTYLFVSQLKDHSPQLALEETDEDRELIFSIEEPLISQEDYIEFEPLLTDEAMPVEDNQLVSGKKLVALLLEKAHVLAKRINCEGQFNLNLDSLQKIPPQHQFEHVCGLVETAWSEATAREHKNTASRVSKMEALQSLREWYYQYQASPARAELFFHKVFERYAEIQPNHLAIIDDAYSLTYQALNKKANQLAHALLAIKKKQDWLDGHCVGLFFENSGAAVISLLAVMKAGLSYLPLTVDSKLRINRLAEYVKQAQVDFLLVQDELTHHDFLHYLRHQQPSLQVRSVMQLVQSLAPHASTNLEVEIDANQQAYVIFSSGSTGVPKGIRIAHRGLMYPTRAVGNVFQITAQDRIGWHSLLTFDASLLDIMTALGNGATLVIVPRAIRTQVVPLTQYLVRHQVTLITLVPSMLEAISPKELPFLRGYISTGEHGQEPLFEKWHSEGRHGQKPRIGINGIGHTEATICTALGFYIPKQELHVGKRPIEGLRWYILTLPDKITPYPAAPKLVEQGERGELYLAGECLGLGYIGNVPYQQRFRTIVHPENPEASLRIYQTGDVVVMNQEGYVQFVDRIDKQCKFFGELVHLRALEQAIQSHELNAKVELQIPEGASCRTERYLTAFIKTKQPGDLTSVKVSHLATQLKYHPYCNFVPSRYITVSDWVTNANGKIDVKATAHEKQLNVFYPGSFVKILPKEGLENQIANFWYDILSIKPDEYVLGADDNFFALGGVSLHASLLLQRIQESYPTFLQTLPEFFHYPTLRALCTQIRLSLPQDHPYKMKFSNHPIVWLKGEKEWLAGQRLTCPVILVHSVLGNPLNDYPHLIAHWPSHQPLLAIQSLALQEPGYHAHSMEKLASDYLALLKTTVGLVHYEGPLYFIGYSAAGTLAYEMAAQWQAQQHSAYVCCIDTPSIEHYKASSQLDYANEFHGMMEELFRRKTLAIKGKVCSAEVLAGYSKSEQLAFYWHSLLKSYSHAASEDAYLRALGRYMSVFNLIQNYFGYSLRPIKAETAVLLSFSHSQEVRKDSRLGWPLSLPMKVLTIEDAKHLDFIEHESWVKTKIVPLIQDLVKSVKISSRSANKNVQTFPVSKEFLQNLLDEKTQRIEEKLDKISLSNLPLPAYSFEDYSQEIKKTYLQIELPCYFEDVYIFISEIDDKTKQKKTIKELLTSSKKSLVFGNFGAGKSTLLEYICLTWAQNKGTKNLSWVTQYDLVLYLPWEYFLLYTSLYKKDSLAAFINFLMKKKFGLCRSDGEIESTLHSKEKNILWLVDDCPDLQNLARGKKIFHELLGNEHVIITAYKPLSQFKEYVSHFEDKIPNLFRDEFGKNKMIYYKIGKISNQAIEEHIKAHLELDNKKIQYLYWYFTGYPSLKKEVASSIFYLGTLIFYLKMIDTTPTLTEIYHFFLKSVLKKLEASHFHNLKKLKEAIRNFAASLFLRVNERAKPDNSLCVSFNFTVEKMVYWSGSLLFKDFLIAVYLVQQLRNGNIASTQAALTKHKFDPLLHDVWPFVFGLSHYYIVQKNDNIQELNWWNDGVRDITGFAYLPLMMRCLEQVPEKNYLSKEKYKDWLFTVCQFFESPMPKNSIYIKSLAQCLVLLDSILGPNIQDDVSLTEKKQQVLMHLPSHDAQTLQKNDSLLLNFEEDEVEYVFFSGLEKFIQELELRVNLQNSSLPRKIKFIVVRLYNLSKFLYKIPPAKNIFHASEFIGAKNKVNIKHFKPYFNKLLEGENFFITYPLKKNEATLMGSEIYLEIRTTEVFDLDKFPPNTYVLVDHPSTTFRLGNVFLIPSMTAVFSMMLYPLRWCVPPLASKFWGLCESNSPNAFALLKLGIAIILGYSFVIELWTAIKKFSFESFMGFACFFIAVCFLFNIIGFTGILGEEVAGSMTMMHILCPAMIFAIFNYFNKNPLLYYVSGPVGMRGENIIEKVEGLKVFLEDKKKSNSSLMNLSTEDKLTIKEMIRKYHEKKTKVEEEEIVAEISKLDGSRDYLNKKQYDRLIDFSKDMRHNTSIPGLQANDYSASLLLTKIWENRTNGDPNASNRQDLFNRQPTSLSAIHLSDPITQSKNRETATVKRIISDLNNEELSILHNGNNESLQEWGRQTELLHSLLRKENFVTLVEIQNLKAYFDSMLDYIARNNHATRELTEKSLGIVKDYLEAIEAKKPQMVSTSCPVFFKATKQDFRQTINAETEGLWVSDEEAKQFCRENRIEGFRAIARDGNCFFHTVLAALPKEHPLNQHPEGYQQLRQQAVQYMRNNPERFPPSCIEGESLDAYLNRMAQPAQWAEGAIIDATALLLNITINVIQLEKENDEIKTSGHFTASEVGNAEGAIVVVRVNQNHYHLGVPLQPDLQSEVRLKR